jgi:hypothetical protein
VGVAPALWLRVGCAAGCAAVKQGHGGSDTGWIIFALLVIAALVVTVIVLNRRIEFYRGRDLAESPPDPSMINFLQTRLERLPNRAADCHTLCYMLSRSSLQSQMALERVLNRLEEQRSPAAGEEEPYPQ